jgi:glycosyltransferase involved in cell wall biosynthesis
MSGPAVVPDITLVMPCYNEEEVIVYTIPQLVQAFTNAGHRFELIAVDNGSSDRTGEIIGGFARQGLPVIPHRVEKNEGYGFGVLIGFPLVRSPWVGIIPADGQVDPEDVVRLYETVSRIGGRILGKVRRRFRMDGLLRKIVSVAYNLFVWILWPRLGSIDVNGCPKIFRTELLPILDLQSRRWFLDPELMVKTHYLGIRTMEMNVFARMRGSGISHVRAGTCWEFFKGLLHFRFSKEVARWRKTMVSRLGAPAGSRTPPGAATAPAPPVDAVPPPEACAGPQRSP